MVYLESKERSCTWGANKDRRWLNKRAMDFLDEYKKSQDHLSIPSTVLSRDFWQPPPLSIYKLNFDAAIFSDLNYFGFGAIICNEGGKVMASMFVKGPYVNNNEEAEALACRKAIEFSIDASFTKLVIEGDNVNVTKAISSPIANHSLLGHVFEDIQCLVHGL